MAANDILVRLLMDASGFHRDLSRSERETKNFEKNIRSNISKAAGTFTKLAGAVGVGVTAFELFDKTIKASQTTSDAYDKVMRAATSTVNSFFTAISTGDFSAFSAGMDAMISKAVAAQAALDQLGNTTMSYNYFNTRNQADFADALAVLRNPNSSAEKKAAAQATVDRVMGSQQEITRELSRRVKETVGALVVEGNQLDASMITGDVVDRVLALDIKTTGDAEKKRLEDRYKEYQKILGQVRQKYATTTYSSGNWGTMSSTSYNQDAINREMAAYNAEFLDAIAYNEILVRNNDEWLQQLINISSQAWNAERALAGMNDQQREVMTSLNAATPTKAAPTKAAQTVYQQGSLGFINQQLQELEKKYAEAADDGTRIGLKKAIADLELQRDRVNTYAGIIAGGVSVPKGIPGTELNLKIGDPKLVKSDDVQLNFEYADSLNAIGSAMGAISSMTGEGAAAWLQWGANVASAIAQVLPQIQTLIAAKTAEGAISAGASAAQTPLVGWLMAGGAIAAFLAAAASVPKFAQGGVVGGSSFIGDKQLAYLNSGEMVLSGSQQSKLFDIINSGAPGPTGGQVEFKIRGQELYGVLNNYNNKRGKTR